MISTLLKARKSTFREDFSLHLGGLYCLMRSPGVPSSLFSVAKVLAFLQRGVDQKLALSMIKAQVSALVTFFQRPLAMHSLVRSFIQGVPHVVPPCVFPVAMWTLNLVFSALLMPPFEHIRVISLLMLLQKVAFQRWCRILT